MTDIIVNGSSQILPVQVVYGITVKHPFTLCNIIITQFASMLKHTVKNPTMDRDITSSAEIQCLRRKYLGCVGRDFIRLLLFFVIRLALSFRLIIAFYQFTCFINVYFALNVLASRSLQIIRSLQPIHCLQPDCCLPYTGFLLLARLALADVFIEVYVALF